MANSKTWSLPMRPLCNRNIIICLDDGVAKEDPTPRYLVVEIAAIIDPEAQHLEDTDIQSEHLNWDIFVKLILQMDQIYDMDRIGLVFVVPDGEPGAGEYDVGDEDQSKWAVGVLNWHASQKVGTVSLLMFLKQRTMKYKY